MEPDGPLFGQLNGKVSGPHHNDDRLHSVPLYHRLSTTAIPTPFSGVPAENGIRATAQKGSPPASKSEGLPGRSKGAAPGSEMVGSPKGAHGQRASGEVAKAASGDVRHAEVEACELPVQVGRAAVGHGKGQLSGEQGAECHAMSGVPGSDTRQAPVKDGVPAEARQPGRDGLAPAVCNQGSNGGQAVSMNGALGPQDKPEGAAVEQGAAAVAGDRRVPLGVPGAADARNGVQRTAEISDCDASASVNAAGAVVSSKVKVEASEHGLTGPSHGAGTGAPSEPGGG